MVKISKRSSAWNVWASVHSRNSTRGIFEVLHLLLTCGCKAQYDSKIYKPRNIHIHIYVVVNFLSQLIFIFRLFLGMVINANEFETKEV